MFQAGSCLRRSDGKGILCKVAGRLKKSFRRPTCHAYDYAALIVPTAVCICIGMHAVKRRNRTHEIHNLHKTHRPIFAKFFSVGAGRSLPELASSCLSILAKANMLKQLKLCFRPGSACAGATERAFCKVAGRLKKSFRRPTCHAYDYAALIVPTAVCICIYARRETA